MNIMSTDTNRLDLATQFSHFLWSAPLQIMVATGILGWQLGLSGGFRVSLTSSDAHFNTYADSHLH